jgi:hypothetical protein
MGLQDMIIRIYDPVLVTDKSKAGLQRRAILGTDLKAERHNVKETP